MTVGEYIRERRKALGMPASEVARIAGISAEYVHYIEKGARKSPTLDVIMRILRALQADPNEFLLETGYLPVNVEPAPLKIVRKVPIISWVAAGSWHQDGAPGDPAQADEWTETDVRGKKVFALKVKGDSMAPEFSEGEVIIVNPDAEAVPGDFVILKNDGDEATFKQLKKYGKTLVLHPLNPKYEDIELKKGGHRYRIVGKVVRKEKKY